MTTRKNHAEDHPADATKGHRKSRRLARRRPMFAAIAVFAHLAIFGNMGAPVLAQPAPRPGALAPGWVDPNSFEAWSPNALLKRAVAAPPSIACPAGRDSLRIAVVNSDFAYEAGAADGLWAPDTAHEDLMAQDADERRTLRARLAPAPGAPDVIRWSVKLDPSKAHAVFCYPRLGDAQPRLGPPTVGEAAMETALKGLRWSAPKGVEPTFIWYAAAGALSHCTGETSGARYDYDKDGKQVWTGTPVESPAVCTK